MGLCKGHGPIIHVMISTYITPLITIQETKTSIGFTIPVDPSKVWKEYSDSELEKIDQELNASNKKRP